MAVRILNREVSDLCLGKPALRPIIPATSTVSEALAFLKRATDHEIHVFVWNFDEGRCVGKICMVDVICFLCKQDSSVDSTKALEVPVSEILPKGDSIVRHLDPNSSLHEAIDHILEGTHNLIIPIRNSTSTNSRREAAASKSNSPNGLDYCWLMQEDVARFLLNSIGVFSPMPTSSIESLNMIDRKVMTVRYHDPAISALDSISRAHVEQTSVAVVDDDNRLVGEISPATLSYCKESAAAAIVTLSAGDLMAYIDYGGPPEDLVELVKTRLQEKKIGLMLELSDEESLVLSSSSSSASSCSSDDESGSGKNVSGRYSPARRSEAITCYPGSSLVAVLIQALAHRATSVWVIDEEHNLVGVVTFKGILKVFRSIAYEKNSKPEKGNLSTQY